MNNVIDLTASHVPTYLDDLALSGLRPTSIYQHHTLLRRFSRHIAPALLHAATTEHLRDFLLRTKANGQPISQGTQAGEASWLRSYFGWLQRTGRRTDNPTARMPRPKHPRRLPRPIGELSDHGLPQTGWVFPHTYDQDMPIRPWSVSTKAAAYLRSCGIDATIHQLRHRFATAVYQTSGRDLRTTQELMRHATPVSTAIYTWIDPADGFAAVDAL
ncbi:MAG: tyrosine-type recombinase/integrase [Microthrixaceae bacterium]